MIDLSSAYEVRDVLDNKVIDSIIDEFGNIWYEAFKKLIASGVPPITLQKCKGVDLVDYKIYGNSVQKILPLEYQEVEYIESVDGQYIDTGFMPNQDSSVEIYGNQINRETNSLFGVNPYFVITSGSSKYRFRYNNISIDTTILADTLVKIALKKNEAYINDELIGTFETSEFQTTYNALLFGRVSSSGNVEENKTNRIYYAKIWDNDVLVRHFIPCYRKSDNVIGMYDIVNKTFYENTGTGVFVKGNDTETTAIPTPDLPIEVESVGEKTSNALVFPYHNIPDVTIYGITFKTNPDHSITMNGTVTQDFPRQISANNGFIEGDTEIYTLFGCFGGSLDTYYMQTQNGYKDTGNGVLVSTVNDKNIIRIFFKKGAVLDNVTIYPMLVKGNHVGNLPEYEPYGYKIPVKVRGKNIIGNWEYGWIDQNGNTTERTDRMRTDYIEIENKIYTASGGTTYTNYTLYDEDYNLINGKGFGATGIIKINNSTGSAKYIRLAHPDTDVSSMQLEVGDNATPYEPYIEPITTNIYLNEPLRKIGDYADYIDFEKQRVFRNILKEQLGSGQSWKMYTDVQPDVLGFYYSTNKRSVGGYCNIVKHSYDDIGAGAQLQVNYEACTLQPAYAKISLFKSRGISDVATLKTYLDSIHAYFCVPLTTPTEEEIELPNIPTHKGTSIIEVDTSILPSNMEVKYYGKE